MKEQTLLKLVCLLLFIVILILAGSMFFMETSDEILYKELLLIDVKLQDISVISQEADQYHNEAGYSYETSDWDSVGSNCRLARDKYLIHSQRLREILNSISDCELCNLKKDMINENIIIDESLYEACEHFESASRYYSKYFLKETPVGDSSYEMGGNEIKAMNENIIAHDEAVKRFNGYLASYTIKLEEILED